MSITTAFANAQGKELAHRAERKLLEEHMRATEQVAMKWLADLFREVYNLDLVYKGTNEPVVQDMFMDRERLQIEIIKDKGNGVVLFRARIADARPDDDPLFSVSDGIDELDRSMDQVEIALSKVLLRWSESPRNLIGTPPDTVNTQERRARDMERVRTDYQNACCDLLWSQLLEAIRPTSSYEYNYNGSRRKLSDCIEKDDGSRSILFRDAICREVFEVAVVYSAAGGTASMKVCRNGADEAENHNMHFVQRLIKHWLDGFGIVPGMQGGE